MGPFTMIDIIMAAVGANLRAWPNIGRMALDRDQLQAAAPLWSRWPAAAGLGNQEGRPHRDPQRKPAGVGDHRLRCAFHRRCRCPYLRDAHCRTGGGDPERFGRARRCLSPATSSSRNCFRTRSKSPSRRLSSSTMFGATEESNAQCEETAVLRPSNPKRAAEWERLAAHRPAGRSGDHHLHLGYDRHAQGVMLTHGNIASNMTFSLAKFDFTPGDTGISFLPLSHITARHLDYCLYLHAVVVAYCPHIEDLPQALLEVQPTVIVAVPRVYEKVREKANAKASSGLKRAIFAWAMRTGAANLDDVFAGKTPSGLSWRLAMLWSIPRFGPDSVAADAFSYPAAHPSDTTSRAGMPA